MTIVDVLFIHFNILGERGEDGRNGIPGKSFYASFYEFRINIYIVFVFVSGSPGSPGQCPNDCYYTQLYMQQLQAAHAQQQQTKGPSPLSLNIKG